jgi:hypothetical protein
MMMQMLMSVVGGGGQGGATGGMSGISNQMGTTALGAIQTVGSLIMLNNLRKTPRARYEITPEMQDSYGRAQQMAQSGFTGAEQAAFQQNMAQNQNAAFQNASQMAGGGMGRAISGGLLSNRLGALNQFAGQDAALMRQNVRYADQRGDTISGQRNRQTAEDINYRNMQERAIGESLKAGTTNLASGINSTQATGGFGGGQQGLGMGGGNMSSNSSGGFGMPNTFGIQPSGFEQPVMNQSNYGTLYGSLPF